MTLTLDVVADVNYPKIEAEVEKVKDRLAQIPDRVRIDIDVAISNDAAQKIKNIQSSIESIVRSFSVSSAMKATAKDINTTTQSTANMGKTTSYALQEQIDALTGVSSATKSAKDSADAMKMAWSMQAEEARAAAKAGKEQEQQIKRTDSANQKSITTLGKAEEALRNCSSAQHSSSQASQDAYDNLQKAASLLKDARQKYASGAIGIDELEEATKNTNTALREAEVQFNRTGDATETFGKRLQNIASRYTTRLIATQAVTLAVKEMRKMVTEAIAIDDAMTQMQIVTKASSSEMSKFGDNAANVAKQTASSITDVIDSATTYARLGYNTDTSTALAKYTSMISKVGDIGVSDVQSAVTAIVKAFNIDASDTDAIESVFDKMVEVGNNLPVSVSELAEGLNNASSSLAAAGNSYEQSLALLAASNATVQDISKSSTGLRTIVARIRNTKTELDDLGETMSDAEYDDIVQALTKYQVSLTDDSGNLRNTYDVMKDIAGVAKELKETSPNDYAALAETLAGTRMQNIFFSLVENFDEAEKAMGLMGESTGKLDEAFATYSDSISAHIQQFKTQFQELSAAVIDSGLANGVIDIGTGFLSLATSLQKVSALLPTIITLVSAGKSIKNISSAAGENGINSIKDFITIANKKESGSNLIKTLTAMKTAWEETGKAANGSASLITKALSSISAGWASLGILGKVGLVIAAISAVVAVVDALHVSAKEATENMNEAFEEYETAKGNVSSVSAELQTANERITELQAKGGLTFVEEAELEKLRESTELLTIQEDLAQKEEARKAAEAAESAEKAFYKNYKYDISRSAVDEYEDYADLSGNNTILLSDEKNISSMLAGLRVFKQLRSEVEKGSDDWENYNNWVEGATEALEGQLTELAGYKEKLELLPEESLTDSQRELLNNIDSAIELIYRELDPAKWNQMKLDNLLSDSDMSDMKNQLIEMASEMKTVGVSVDDVESKFPGLADAIKNAGIEMKDFVDYINSEAGVIDVDGAMSAITKRFAESDSVQNVDWRSAQMALDSFDAWLNSLSPDDLALVYEMSLDTSSATWSLDEWQNKLERSKEVSTDSLHDIEKASEETIAALSGITSAQEMLSSQETGKSISISDLTADGMEDYASALEYVNGVYQLSAEKVNAIIEAKTKEQIAVNNANKANAQQEYLKNAKQIEKYREELESAEKANDGTADSIRENINNLLSQNAALRDECTQYDLMSSALLEATSAYQTWLNAKSSSQTGDMFDEALSAAEQIDNVLNNSESDLFGRVGRTDYKAAVDFIVPDSVDHEDAEAVDSYISSISDMFTFDDNGNRTGLNIDNFIQESLNEGLIAINDAGDAYEIAGNKTMQDFANGLGLSLPLVQAMFGELEEFGAKFDWADEATQTIGDLGVAAYESAEALRSVEQFKDLKIVMDVSGFEDAENACDTLDSTIKQMQDLKLTPDIDDAQLSQIDDVIRYCVAQKQLLSEPAIMSVDVSKVNSEIAPALDLLQQFQNAQNALEIAAEVGADTSAAEAEIDSLVSQIQGLDPEILAQLGLDPASAESIQTYITNLDADAIVTFGIDSSLVDAFESADHSARGVVNWYDNTSNLSKSFSRVGYVYWQNANNPSSGSSSKVNGTANVSGSACLSGDWRTRGGKSLVGELGREIIVDPNTGRWYTVGDNGAEFVNVPDGAIIFNHKQSDALLKNGRVAGRGGSYANGSALVTGFIPVGIGSGGSSSSSNSGYYSPSNGASSSIESNYDAELETVDWIVIAIDRIERVIDKLGKTAESAFKKLRTRLLATNDEIETVVQEIELQQRAYNKYMSAAEAVNLSSDLKQLVRNGAIDISQYDQDTRKLIDDYQELYEKALDCSVAIDDLHENLASLYQSKFDSIQEDYDNQLSLMEKQSDVLDRKINMLEEQGYMQNANYYIQLQNIESKNIKTLKSELADLNQAFSEAMSSGEIEEGSDAWYEMTLAIEDTRAAIEEAELAIVEYNNTIREIEWDYFDYAQERIGQITSEADFLMSLLDSEDMYDSNGSLSESGIAAGGLYAEKYGIYMAQADKYADEIKRINEELANDPNNTELIERRDELIASQREAILAAKSEKEALVDLAKGGIQIELDAVKELIDAYTESLDSAKDLYDYQKKIADKAKNITDLEKQLAAYQNDTSEETRSKIQKIQVQLAEAKDDLEETEYERFVSDSKKMLDSLYSEYEEVLNSRFDDIDSTFASMIDLTNENFASINEYLSEIADSVGYTISDETNSTWGNGGGANGFVSVYGEDISTKLTATGLTVDNIFSLLGEIAKQNGVDFPAAKSYASGGLIDYTGVANVHGTSSNPELVLNASDTENFIMLRDALRNIDGTSLYNIARVGDYINGAIGGSSIYGVSAADGGYSVGSINVSIPIERVEDYNDFVNQLRSDRQFEKMIQDITIGTVAGKSKLVKNKYKW